MPTAPKPFRLNDATIYEDRRKNSHQRGYTRQWYRMTALFRMENPCCRYCGLLGQDVAATVVDHIQPHRGNAELFWDQTNWQHLCKACHDAKTASGL